MLNFPQNDVIDALLSLMWFPLMLVIPFIGSFFMLKMIKRLIISDSYMSSSSFSSSVGKDTYSPRVNLNKSNYSSSSSKKSSSSNSSNSDYLVATSLAASSYSSYDSSSSYDSGCSSSSYDSGSSSSYDSGSSCGFGD
ncbi:RNA-binding protein [Bacillus thuringiensis]|nr:RNA-binding protein [Bacillus cereus]MRB06100.1 RNA-binding protein [Bacillus thuringiensis]MEB9431737.1 RNA-binding protein [Bacillus cereus]MEB9481603.1 RNA-binding protein [Bacillus cereus]MRC50110.1 RNA-binding protein [Bacillus thuringiensis]